MSLARFFGMHGSESARASERGDFRSGFSTLGFRLVFRVGV